MTQARLAARMKTTQPAIARFEAGDSDPRLSTVARYAEAVGFVIDTAPAHAVVA
ncbi:MAG: helix-turn-helix domain-containing protein [Candidatus Dormibacteraceae bacterium]